LLGESRRARGSEEKAHALGLRPVEETLGGTNQFGTSSKRPRDE